MNVESGRGEIAKLPADVYYMSVGLAADNIYSVSTVRNGSSRSEDDAESKME